MAFANYSYEMKIMKPEYTDTFMKFKEVYETYSTKRQLEEEARMRELAVHHHLGLMVQRYHHHRYLKLPALGSTSTWLQRETLSALGSFKKLVISRKQGKCSPFHFTSTRILVRINFFEKRPSLM
ncbi:unnamed protein product, partial [Mesorhabditis belari]|uniref:Uncharacterized protein n=1 Tax=Mesorhabditis belari TaxID=2138241 RepID=A0AAF3EL28_9BILA